MGKKVEGYEGCAVEGLHNNERETSEIMDCIAGE